MLDPAQLAELEASLRAALQHARRSSEEGSAMDAQLEHSAYCTGRQPEPAYFVPQIKGLTPPPPQGTLLSMTRLLPLR